MDWYFDCPTIWTYPSIVEGVTETLYWGCPNLAPTSTYKTNAIKAGTPIVVPTRATATIETPAVIGAKGEVLQPATYKREIVLVTEYKALLAAKEAELAKVAEPTEIAR